MKTLWTRSAVFVFMFVFSSVALVAADSPNYDFRTVEINNLIAFNTVGGTPGVLLVDLNVEQLETINVELTLKAASEINQSGFLNFVDQVVCSASVDGYEFGQIRDTTPIFTVEEGKVYKKTLQLVVPDDIELSESYTLRIECSDTVDQEEISFRLFLNEIRHYVKFFDVILNPSNKVGAGKPLFVVARLENLGQKAEDDIKVTAAIPELGVSAANFLDELVTKIQEEEEEFLFEEESSGQVELLLRIPEDAKTGEYTLIVEAEYNRGHSKVSQRIPVSVVGRVEERVVETVVNVDATSRQVKQGEEATFRLMVANIGAEKRALFSIVLDGTEPWSSASVEPAFLTVEPDGAGEAMIRVMLNENAQPRDYVFVARVMLGNQIIAEKTLRVRVTEKVPAVVPAGGTPQFKTILAVVFGVLVVILVVLGVIIAMRRAEEPEVPAEKPAVGPEAQTYYYMPKR